MGPSRKIFYSGSALLPTRLLKRMTPDLLLPYHHLVSDEDVLHIKHLYPCKNVAQFTADLDVLLKHYRPVPVEEVAGAVLEGRRLPQRGFLLTFDDGFRQVYEIIAPILRAKGVPAVFFVNPAFLDNRELFYRSKISLAIDALLRKKDQPGLWKECGEILRYGGMDTQDLPAQIKKITNLNQSLLDKLAPVVGVDFDAYLRDYRPFMTIAQAWELHRQGFTIGAHSWDHPYYDLIPEEEQRRQTLQSMEFVREKYAPPYRLFSFPHSDAGLPQGFFDRQGDLADVWFGIQNQKLEPGNRVLHRFNAERPDFPMSKQLNGVLLYMLIQKMRGRLSVRRRK